MEEELQQSVMLSEDAEYETADTAGEDVFTPAATKERTLSTVFAQTTIRGTDGMEVDEEDDDDELSDRDASGEEIDEEMDQDAEGEDYTEIVVDQQIVVSNGRPFQMNDDDNDDDDEEEDEEDEDADGEEDGDEGVGAVKIKPGDTDDEDEDDEDAESDVSEPLSNAEDDSDEEPAWEDAGEVEEDDESETGPSNVCMFCKQDEENDPSEDFEAFLTCTRCNENGGSWRNCKMSIRAWLTYLSSPAMRTRCGGDERTEQ